MGTLMYGAGHVWEGQAHFYLHDGELFRSPPDETFIHMLQQNCCLTGPHFPPPAIVEALQDYVTHYYKVRRLHLIVVDLWRPWKHNTARAKEITDQLWYISHCADTHRVSPFRPDGPEPPLRCRRFAYGYALDGSECPSYLVWPQRDGHSYVLLDTSTNDTLPLNQEFFRPLGMEHFYDSFALESQISVRREALRLFGLRENELMPDLHITRDGVLRIRLGAHQEHRVNHVARATDRTKVSADVIQLAAHEEDPAPQQDMSEGDASDSDGSESASDSEQNDPPSSLVADAEQYELMQLAYAAVGKDFTGKEDLIGAKYSKLLKLEMVPERWPLARLSFSLQTCVDHLDRVLAGCCWEVQATRTTPSESLASLHEVAKCLTMKLAVYLAKEVAAILRAVLTHETKKLYNDSTVHLLCSNYWVQPIYRELLHSSSRSNATRECERKRPSSGLARVTAYPKPPKRWRPSASGTSFSDWIGGVIAGVFRQKGAAPWGITNAEKLQLSVFLPNDLSLEDWYAGVYGLPTVWPEVSMMGADHLRKVAGYDFHDLRKKYDVKTMWGDLDPQWRLLQSQLVARGPGWYSPADLKERLFTNKSKRLGDDMKEALRTDDNTIAWQAWNVAHDLIWQSCRPGPPLVFPGEKELIRAMYDQIGEEEQVMPASDSDQNDPPSSLVADAEQYELMQVAYAAVGKDNNGQEDLIGEGERKRPRSGLARVAAYPKPPKQRKPSASGASFSDWIGGTCCADTLQVWFPAHWAPVVLQQLQQKEDSYRAENPSWMDQEVAPADIRKQWQEARANRRMQFKVGNYRDGSWESNIRMLTGTIKVDWIQLPVELYLAALPTLKQGVIAGVSGRKASMLGADNLRKVAGYDFHLLRKKYDVRSMWGDLDPQWRLLQSQLETRGPGWYSPAELKERLFTNKSNRPGDDTKEALRTDGNTTAWQAWYAAQNLIWQLCQPAPPLVFPGEQEIFRAMYAQIGEEEQVISPPYTRTPLDASMRGRKKRKQGEDNALVG
eukprot:symbB.v1.2.041250.t1/scaffold7975.1/size9582/1